MYNQWKSIEVCFLGVFFEGVGCFCGELHTEEDVDPDKTFMGE